MDDETMVIIDGSTGQIEHLPPSKGRHRAKLESLADIRKEMSKVYRESRTGTIDPTQAAKSVWILSEIKKVVEAEMKLNDPQSVDSKPMSLADFYGQESITTKDPIQAAKDYQQLMR